MMRKFSAALLFVTVGCSGDERGGSSANGGGSGGNEPPSGAGGTSGSVGSAAGAGADSAAIGGAGAASAGASARSGPIIEGCPVFPADNAWNTDVSALPVHPRSDAFIDAIGRDAHVHPDFGTEWEGAPIGIPYVTVAGSQPPVPIEFTAYGEESDPGPYPVPPNAPIEGGPDADGDRHVIVVDTGACRLYELFRAFPANAGALFRADSGAVFELTSNDHHPFTFTSADAAGLPIFPGLVRYDEIVERGVLEHAVRVTVSRSQAALVAPARHYASSSTDPNLPPMGLRLRLKASHDCNAYSREARVICTGLKRYGMIVADNGSSWYLSGAPDPRWNDEALGDLKSITGDAFEVVETGPIERY